MFTSALHGVLSVLQIRPTEKRKNKSRARIREEREQKLRNSALPRFDDRLGPGTQVSSSLPRTQALYPSLRERIMGLCACQEERRKALGWPKRVAQRINRGFI